MSEEFIREVDEDLKEEKRLKLWKKFLPYIVSVSLGVILSTSGLVIWDNYSSNLKQRLGDDFTAAVELAIILFCEDTVNILSFLKFFLISRHGPSLNDL